MIQFSFLGIKFSLPLLTVITPILANKLGMKLDIFPMLAALSLHELGHIISARALGIEIHEIRILPFGGSARMENPYAVNPLRLMITAFCGPLVNLFLIFMFAALAQWGLLAADYAGGHVRINLLLLLFNLCPVLPLDGGRILYALLQRPMGQARSLRLCAFLSRVFAAVLTSGAIILFFIKGTLNLAFVLTSIFIFTAVKDEYDSFLAARSSLFYHEKDSMLPVRFHQVSANHSALDAIRLMRPHEANWFLVAGKEPRLISDRDIINHLSEAETRNVSFGHILADIREAQCSL